MIKLVGNPNSVADGYGDQSIGYFDGFEKDLLVDADNELMEDINLIINSYKNKGYNLEPKDAYYAWYEYSNSLSAHWLDLGPISDKRDENIIDVTKKFLKGV